MPTTLLSRSYAPAVQVATLPAGVTLQAIDGETMTSPTTMSNNYYTRNGYSNAHTMGWDNLSFFPIGCGPAGPQSAADVSSFQSFGLTFFGAPDNNSCVSLSNGACVTALETVPFFQGYTTGGALNLPTLNGSYAVALAFDEPQLMSDWQAGLQAMHNAGSAGRFMFLNFQIKNQMVNNGNLGGTLTKDVIATVTVNADGSNIPVGVVSLDAYFINDASDPTQNAPAGGSSIFLGGSRNMTADECARGCWYGDMIREFRSMTNGGAATGFTYGSSFNTSPQSTIPIHIYLENGTPDTTTVPTAAQMNWSAWSVIIAGARLFSWFNFSQVNAAAGAGSPLYNFGDTTDFGSLITGITATNAQITSFASIINSPFAMSFVSVSPAAFMTNQGNTNMVTGGIDIMAKWFGGKFYIFATTRYGSAGNPINQAATFTIPTGVGSTATILDGRGGSKSISGGVFTDTFVHSYDVFIYRIDP